jgi:hypothetical protein
MANDPEKAPNPTVEDAMNTKSSIIANSNKESGRKGYVFSAQIAHSYTGHLRTTKDSSISLIPQPSDDPNDPLNWSQANEKLILFIVSCTGTVLPQFWPDNHGSKAL